MAYLQVTLEGSLEPTREFVVLDVGPLGGDMEQGLEVIVNMTGLLTDYQVSQMTLGYKPQPNDDRVPVVHCLSCELCNS